LATNNEVKKKLKNSSSRFLLGYRLSTVGKVVLRQLGEGNSQAETAINLQFSKPRVNYWARKFLKQGFLREKNYGRPKEYDLTALGTKLLTTSDREFPLPCVMEDYPFKYALVRDLSRIEWEKLGEPRNWEKFWIHVGEVRVEKTSRSIIVHTGQLSGFDPDDLLFQAGQINALVKAILQDRGVVVASVGLPLHKPMFKFFTPEAEVIHRVLGNVSTENGTIDNSPPEKLPHQEHDRDAAKDFIDLGPRVRVLSERQGVLESKLNGLDSKLERIEALQERLVELQERFTTAFEQFVARPGEGSLNKPEEKNGPLPEFYKR
jgi:hypothetical protein